MIQIKVEANGVSVDDAINALLEVKRRIKIGGQLNGHDNNGISSFEFTVEGEEEDV